MDFHAGDDHRPLGLGQELRRFVDRFVGDLRIARRLAVVIGVRRCAARPRPCRAESRCSRAACSGRPHRARGRSRGRRSTGSISSVAGDAQLLEHFDLRAEVAHLVVQQRIVDPLGQPRRAADHHHRRLLGIRPGDRVADRQAADAVRHAHRPQAVDAGISVGREARAVLARAADDLDRAFFKLAVERQDVIARDAEHVLQAIVLQPANQVLPDRQPRRRPRGLPAPRCRRRHRFQSRHFSVRSSLRLQWGV